MARPRIFWILILTGVSLIGILAAPAPGQTLGLGEEEPPSVGGAMTGAILPIAILLGLLALYGTAYMPGALFAAYLLVPFYKGALQAYSPVDLTSLLALLNAIQVVPLLLARRRQRISLVGIGLWIGMALLVLGGVLYAPDYSLALSHAVSYWALVLLPILPAAWRVGSDPRQVRAFLWTFLIMGVLTVVLGLLSVSGAERLVVLNMNTIQVSRAALLVPIVGVAFALRSLGSIGRLAMAGLIPAALLVALASGSRGPLFAFVLMAVFAGVRYLARPHAFNWRRTGGIAGLALASVVVVSLAAPELPLISIGRFTRLGDFVQGNLAADSGASKGDTSAQGRLKLYGQAVMMFGDQPLLGAGTSGFQAFSLRLLGEKEADRHPHNALLQVAAEFGMVGLAVFVSLLGIALMRRLPGGSAGPWAGAVRIVFIFFLLNAMLSGNIFSDRMTLGLLALLLLIDAPGPAAAAPEPLDTPLRVDERQSAPSKAS